MDNDQPGYNDKLDATDQVDAEEEIAQHIWDYAEENEIPRPCEEDCAQMGRWILLAVLTKFRPDLVE